MKTPPIQILTKWILFALVFSALIHHSPSLLAQSAASTFQGRVTSGGTNFIGVGQFKFALVTLTNTAATATASANPPSGGFITVITVTFGGNGYVTPPAVTISGGGGSGATATASITAGVITAITVNNPGNGFTSAPLVTIAAPPAVLSYTTYWSNDGTSTDGSEPAAAVSVAVSDGLFTARLGDTTTANMAVFPPGLFQQMDLHLRVWFNDGLNGFSPLHPTQPLTSVPYAAAAQSASVLLGGLSDGQLGGTYGNALVLSSPANWMAGTFTGEFSGYFSGSVGIGTASPNHRLSVMGGPAWTASGWTGAIELDHASAIGWRANPAGQRRGIGHSSGGLYFFRTTSNPGSTGSQAVYDMVIADNGRVGIGATSLLATLTVGGTIWADSAVQATQFLTTSDRNAKENFAFVDPADALAKVVALPIHRWNFKGEAGIMHLGPVAQDFHAAFGLGADDKAIATVDADGVAMAALQGLNEKVEVRSQRSEVRIQKLETENAELRGRLAALEQLIPRLTQAATIPDALN